MLLSRWLRPSCLLAALALACAERAEPVAEDNGEAQFGGTVVIAHSTDLDNLNSLVAGERFTQEVLAHALFLPLIRYTSELAYEPALAERWDLVDDTAAVFHLRRDVRWHDGMPTTARDVIFTIERVRDPETAYPNADNFALWTAATAPDSFTVRFSFRPHAEPLAGLPILPIMPAHLLDSIPAARMRQAAFNRRPVGNGPFRFVEYRASDRWVFQANPDFPQSLGGRPYLDRLVWRPIPDATAQITELVAGSADVVIAPAAEQFARTQNQPGIRGLNAPSRQFANVMWNGRIAPLDEPRVRRALSMGIDRQKLIQTVRAGYGTLAVGPIDPTHWAFDPQLQPLPFAPDSARALLREAGIEDRNGDGVAELPNGRPFEIELKLPAGSAVNRDMGELIRNDLAAIGVRIVTRAIDFGTMAQDFTSPSRNFQAILLGWNSAVRPNLRDPFHSAAMQGPFQIASYTNARVDSLIDLAARTPDRGEARRHYAAIQRILREEQPWTFLYYFPELVLVRERVQNVELDARGALRNVSRWWVTDPGAQARSDSAGRSPLPDSARPR